MNKEIEFSWICPVCKKANTWKLPASELRASAGKVKTMSCSYCAQNSRMVSNGRGKFMDADAKKKRAEK